MLKAGSAKEGCKPDKEVKMGVKVPLMAEEQTPREVNLNLSMQGCFEKHLSKSLPHIWQRLVGCSPVCFYKKFLL